MRNGSKLPEGSQQLQGWQRPMNIPRRFTLATFMLLVTAVAILFGYAGWRKQFMLSEVGRFNRANNTVIELTGSWLWPVPTDDSMVIAFTKNGSGQLNVRGQNLSVEEARVHYTDFSDCLRSIGVSEVCPGIIREKHANGVTVSEIATFSDIEELAK
jgi:hypothetical protein